MANITVHNVAQGSAEWLEARVGKYTGSNAYKLLSSFGATAYAQAIHDSFEGNFYTKRGHLLEDEAIELYEAIYKTSVERPGFITNDDFPTCLYSPDGIDGDYLLEVKCFNKDKHTRIYNGDIPLPIKAQIHFGLLITGKKKGILIIYNPEFTRGDNPEPRKAFKCIAISRNPMIAANFKKILTEEVAHA